MPAAGLLIGLICGVSEALVVQLLQSRLKPSEKKATADADEYSEWRDDLLFGEPGSLQPFVPTLRRTLSR